MAKIKIIELIKSLSPDEIKLLDKFVKSPVHNKHALVTELFSYVRKNIDKSVDQIYGEKLFKSLFPNEPIEMQKLHHISSYLLKVVEEFLAWQEWKSDQTNKGIELLKSYSRLNQADFFFSTLKKIKKEHANKATKDSLYFEQISQIENVTVSQLRTDNKKKDFRLQEFSDAQDEAFIIQKLKTGCLLLSNQTATKTTYNLGLLPIIQQYCKDNGLLQNPTVAIYYYASKVLSNYQDDDSFNSLKELLIQKRDRFNISDLYDIHVFALNYCIKKLNSGEQKFMREAFDLYQSGLASGIFFQNSMLPPRTYNNIVMSGLRLGEHDEVESFIFNYKDKLPPQQREDFFNFNLAHLYYEKKNYKDAMPLLLKVGTRDKLHACITKTLLAKMYFELNETEALTNHLQSFRMYLRRKKVLGYHKETFLNFINFVQKILLSKYGAEEIHQELLETKIVAEKEWLLEQLKK